MTEMSEKENEPDDAATHTPPGTGSALQETKVIRESQGLDLLPGAPPAQVPSRCGRHCGPGCPGVRMAEPL